MKNSIEHVNHAFEEIKDCDSKILILGSFPSVKSRKNLFYYMHPQNRFYQVLSSIFNEDFVSKSIDEKKKLLLKYHIALYDVIESCSILGSSDSSIKDVVYADIEKLIKNTKIKRIFLNGSKAYELFIKQFPQYNDICEKLLSTSPANAKYSLAKLIENWSVIKYYLK